jgi:L-seryl-tRNA(Ser) seleniumtransferase
MSDFRVIPSIEQLRQRPASRTLSALYGDAATTDALRHAAAALRQRLADGAADVDASAAATSIEQDAREQLARSFSPSLRRVINATGVLVHTNLGRAPLAPAALARVNELAGGYVNLEYDLEHGRRGARDLHAEALICRLTGAEAALVVNNNAAATMLALAGLARGREVVISRAELVEIGGGFRVPDIMAQSGARLREVGTTNRTRAGDYALAIGARTGALMRVHHSNFRIEGFTERATLTELVALARRFSVPLIEDLGSGHVGAADGTLVDEPTVQASVTAGVDVVCFSGDKLLGGPQAGIVAGRAEPLARLRTHPLLRAIRVDKLTYAALEATLAEHLAGRAADTVPVLRMAAMPLEALAVRAEILAASLRAAGFGASVADGDSTVGGGSAPGTRIPSKLVALVHPALSPDALEARLRTLEPPVVARIENDRVVLDLRTVAPEDDQLLAGIVGGLSVARSVGR